MKYFNTFLLFLCCSFYVSAQTWETKSPIPIILHHPFGFSSDDFGYVITGGTETEIGSQNFFKYNPVTDTWTVLDDFVGARRGWAIGTTYEGKPYFGFGADIDTVSSQSFNDLWTFDFDSETWTELASCPCDARVHPAMLSHQGKIYVGLGGGLNVSEKNDWWAYDIATDTWSQKTDFPGGHRHHPFQFTIGDYLYVGFGDEEGVAIKNDWYRYDPSLDEWEQMADLPAEGRAVGAQFTYGEKGYILSGVGDDHGAMEEGEFWEYDPVSNSWTQLPSHQGKSRYAPASFIIDGFVYLAGGIYMSPFANEETKMLRYQLPELNSNKEINTINEIISFYPNPVTNQLNVLFLDYKYEGKLEFEIYNSLEQLVVLKSKLKSSIDLSKLSTGIYFLKIIKKDGYFFKKIFKK